MNLRYCGYRVDTYVHAFGTSGTRFVIEALMEKGTRRKRDARQWRYWYDPSANSGRGAVVENSFVPNEKLYCSEQDGLHAVPFGPLDTDDVED